MAVIRFKNYRVLRMSYEKVADFKRPTGDFNITPEFSVNIDDDDKDNTLIRLGVRLVEGMPFKLDVVIEGSFAYNKQEDKGNVGSDKLFSTNAVAILFPYLRSCVSSLTNLSNENHALILPAMNIVELLKKNSKGSHLD